MVHMSWILMAEQSIAIAGVVPAWSLVARVSDSPGDEIFSVYIVIEITWYGSQQ